MKPIERMKLCVEIVGGLALLIFILALSLAGCATYPRYTDCREGYIDYVLTRFCTDMRTGKIVIVDKESK